MSEFSLEEKTSVEIKTPSDYKVFLLNDDVTTMEFVIFILIKIFAKTKDEAMEIMIDVHKNGKALTGIYCYDIAVSKVILVHNYAQKENFPLRAVYEKI